LIPFSVFACACVVSAGQFFFHCKTTVSIPLKMMPSLAKREDSEI